MSIENRLGPDCSLIIYGLTETRSLYWWKLSHLLSDTKPVYDDLTLKSISFKASLRYAVIFSSGWWSKYFKIIFSIIYEFFHWINNSNNNNFFFELCRTQKRKKCLIYLFFFFRKLNYIAWIVGRSLSCYSKPDTTELIFWNLVTYSTLKKN